MSFEDTKIIEIPLYESVSKTRYNSAKQRYVSVNGSWPENTPKPTPQEALAGAKRLYTKFMEKPFMVWHKGTLRPGKFILTSGNRSTWVYHGEFRVNPDDSRGWRGGWKELVHSMSHYVHSRKFPNAAPHSPGHAFIEKEMIEFVVNSGWLEGKLKKEPKPKPKPSASLVKYNNVIQAIKRWETKAKRATTALKKLQRQRKYYETVNVDKGTENAH